MTTRRPLSTSAKIALGALVAIAVLFLASWLVDRTVDGRADSKVRKAEAEADKFRQAAEQSKLAEARLQAQLGEQQQKVVAAEARAAAAEQALTAVRGIRLKIESDYQRVRDTKPDLSTAPLTAADQRQLCERLRTLGKLPGDFKCDNQD